MRTIEADYLVVGAGAMGMAFIDTLVSETEARVVVVDRHHAPGGHWTMAYPFVRLHQPSAFYGVNSSRLGSDTIDQVGWNDGLYELATAGEICAYYDAHHAPAVVADGPGQLFPDERIPRLGRPVSHAGRRRAHRPRDAPRRRRHLHAGHRSGDAPPRRTRSPTASIASRPTTCPGSPRVSATSSSGPARPVSTPACGCSVMASGRIG